MVRLLLFFSVGCAMSEEEWSSERLRVSCEINYDCTPEDEHQYLPWESLEDCQTPSDTDPVATVDCPFDAKVAEDCLTEWEALSCDDFRSGNMPVCNPYTCP